MLDKIFGGASKAASWPYRLEQVEKKISDYIKAQDVLHGDINKSIADISKSVDVLSERIERILSEAKGAAQSAATTAVSNEISVLRERIVILEMIIKIQRGSSMDALSGASAFLPLENGDKDR